MKIVDLTGKALIPLFRGNALAYCQTTDGREVVLMVRMDQRPMISVGPVRSPVHTEQWVFETVDHALASFLQWDPHTETAPLNHLQCQSRKGAK